MAKFRFIVRADSGKVRRGSLSEETEVAARARLEGSGFEVVSLVESTDLIVHSKQTTQGRAKHTPRRADIIDFEDSWNERLSKLLNRFLLRKEMALALGIVGLIWVVVSSSGKEQQAGPPPTQYVAYEISVTVDTEDYDANAVKIKFPDVPFEFSERVSRDGEGAQTLKVEFEAVSQPDRIEVTVMDAKEVLARGEGHLQSSGPGKMNFTPTLIRVKKDYDD